MSFGFLDGVIGVVSTGFLAAVVVSLARLEVDERRVEDPSVSPVPRLIRCECTEPSCPETIEMTTSLVEVVAALPDCFVLKPGHERVQIERIVETHASYVLTVGR